MGEIADSMINGEMCEVCGVWIEEGDIVMDSSRNEYPIDVDDEMEGIGFPVHCSSCH